MSSTSDDGFEPWSIAWYSCMCAITAFNFAAAIYLFSTRTTNKLLPLAIIFTIVCGYRSVFPTIYLSNACFVSGPQSNPFLARMLAFVAELCWIIQVSFSLMNANALVRGGRGRREVNFLLYFAIFIIFCAECFSTIGTVTKNSLWFTLEEGSWVLTAVTCYTPALFMIYHDHFRSLAPIPHPYLSSYLKVFGITLFIYDFWGVTMDVPSNYGRWVDEKESDDTGWKTFSDGLDDIFNACDLDRSYSTWGGYLLWMTSYFSLCVWSSILLALLTFGATVEAEREKNKSHEKLL
eukprot:CAMPEP_0182472990 /NCGR_PEP_ID=MMETSP1319-20130603/23161_1 /TAXON_ID=172717 /ORGANISM="Bolidomonas pacifica, Strain RCC208" /LENGTH=292 /DNA_ID=CAMNT_0024673735 /DNA_START=99 /DNA_END=974 /DNA_ORIENTATION=+